jgi:Pin2-interacting protein X1
VSGEGRTSAIKATQKLDMLGIGMRQQSNLEGGIAWRQNRDFEDLLRRLNDGTTMETTNSTELMDSFHKARAREPESETLEKVKDDHDDSNGDGEEEREGVMVAKKEKKKKKKRKATAAEEEEVEERESLDRKERKKKRRKKSSSKDDDDEGHAPVPPSSIESERPPPRPSSREARPAKEPGSVPMDTATRPTTAMTAPVPVRAPYVICTFRGSENQRLMYSICPLFHPL